MLLTTWPGCWIDHAPARARPGLSPRHGSGESVSAVCHPSPLGLCSGDRASEVAPGLGPRNASPPCWASLGSCLSSHGLQGSQLWLLHPPLHLLSDGLIFLGCVKLPGADRLEAPCKPDRREVLLLAHTWASHLPRLQAPTYRRPQRVPVYHPQPACPDSAPSSPARRPGGPTTWHSEATVPG